MISARAWAVARWEFLRFAKPRDLLIGTAFFVLMFGGGSLVGEFAARKSNEPKAIGVVESERLGLEGRSELGRFVLSPFDEDPDEAARSLAREEIDAVLAPSSEGWKIQVLRQRDWTPQLELMLAPILRRVQWDELDLDPSLRARLERPPAVSVEVVDPVEKSNRADILTVALLGGLMFFGLFSGFSYVFVAITAEKTQRTTESLLSALRPQEWIDGKILGLTGVVVINLATFVLGYLLWKVVGALFLDRGFDLPSGADGSTLSMSALFSVVGFFFWFTFFALVAATIDDPNSSNRSGVMFLPFLPIAAVFVGLDSPDAPWMRVFSIVPGVSPLAMPVRLLRGEPSWVEIALSFVLLAAGAWFFRWMAGRVFGISMLMTGKEPSLREVLRWVRASD